MKTTLISVKEASQILGISHTHVIRLIKSGKIKGSKVGWSYVIDKSSIVYDKDKLTAEDKKKIDASVKLTIKKYGPVLKKLGST